MLSPTYCLASTLHLHSLRHNLTQIRAASAPTIPDPHLHPQIPGKEPHKLFLSSLLPSRAVTQTWSLPPSVVLSGFPPSPEPELLSQPCLYPAVLLTPFCKVLLGPHLGGAVSLLCFLHGEGMRLWKSWVHVLAQQEIPSAKHQVPGKPCTGT